MTRCCKKPQPQRKTRQVTDATGWTHVMKGPLNIIDPTVIDTHFKHIKATETKYTTETYLDRFRQHHLPVWRASSSFKSLSLILKQDVLPFENIKITQCICLGLGSLTAGSGSENSSYELAALISMLELLAKTHTIRTTIFQDPIFTPLDRTILNELGYTVFETPDAFPLITDTTFLFAPHLECLHYATALEVATPALSVGSDVQVYVDGLLSPLAENTKKGSCQIFRYFMSKTDSKPMPDFNRTSWCESTRIYWLMSKEDDFGEGMIERGVRSMKIAES